jgi:pimeloyl-ACP methyl ester carboxylesterase
MWAPNIAALCRHFRVYALDTVGETGLSVPRAPVTRPRQLFNWLHEAIDALVAARPVSVAGMSFGGWLASQFALQHPARVHKLVLLSPAATVLPVAPGMILRAMPSALPGAAGKRGFYHWLLHDLVASGPAGRAFVDQAVDDCAVAERCFGHLLLAPATVLTDRALRALPARALFMVGANEKIYSAHAALGRLRRVAPGIRTALIPGAGHDAWMTRAAPVNQVLLDFLLEAGDHASHRASPSRDH